MQYVVYPKLYFCFAVSKTMTIYFQFTLKRITATSKLKLRKCDNIFLVIRKFLGETCLALDVLT